LFTFCFSKRLLLQLSTGGTGKPGFVINCGIHAREWIGPATCMYVVKYVSTEYLASMRFA